MLSLPRFNQEITEIQVDIQNETNAKSISSVVDNILAEKCPFQLSKLVRSADLSVDNQKRDMVGIISDHRIQQPQGYPVLQSGAVEEGPLQYNFPRLQLSGGRRRKGRRNRVTDDRYYLVVQFKFTFDDKEYHVTF